MWRRQFGQSCFPARTPSTLNSLQGDSKEDWALASDTKAFIEAMGRHRSGASRAAWRWRRELSADLAGPAPGLYAEYKPTRFQLTPLSFLIERETARRASDLPLQARPNERLRFTAHFWCTDKGSHTIAVLSRGPDGGCRTLATLTKACDEAPALLAFEGKLEALEVPGSHRLQLLMDGEAIGDAKLVGVQGPIQPRTRRAMGRGELASEPLQTNQQSRKATTPSDE